MRRFTDEEYETMISELTDPEKPSFDMLCTIAEKELRPMIKGLCAKSNVLRSQDAENEVMQMTIIRLIRYTVTHFLLRKSNNGVINRNPDEFSFWIHRVAKNEWNSYVRQLFRSAKEKNRNIIMITEPVEFIDEDSKEQEQRLKTALSVVLDADVSVYKILTWLSQLLFVLLLDIRKKDTNEKIIEAFAEKTLNEMWRMILTASQKIGWFCISQEQKEKIENKLNRPYDESRTVGEVKYKEFFMKKGGKATISDWVNRMNRMIRSMTKNGTSSD